MAECSYNTCSKCPPFAKTSTPLIHCFVSDGLVNAMANTRARNAASVHLCCAPTTNRLAAGRCRMSYILQAQLTGRYNRRSGVALAMHHRQQWFIHLRAQRSIKRRRVHRLRSFWSMALLYIIIIIPLPLVDRADMWPQIRLNETSRSRTVSDLPKFELLTFARQCPATH